MGGWFRWSGSGVGEWGSGCSASHCCQPTTARDPTAPQPPSLALTAALSIPPTPFSPTRVKKAEKERLKELEELERKERREKRKKEKEKK